MKEIFEYLELERRSPLGASKYAPLVIIINNKYKIVEELNEENDHYLNMWLFFDYASKKVANEMNLGVNEKENEYIIECAILKTLNTFNKMDAKKREKLSGDEFAKIVIGK